jgi:hypothetical protein
MVGEMPGELFSMLILAVVALIAIAAYATRIEDDLRYIYQGVVLLIASALSLLMGFTTVAGDVVYGDIPVPERLGYVFLAIGAFLFILLCFVWMPKIMKPYDVHVKAFPKPLIKPLQPPQPQQPQRPPRGF